MVKRTKRRRVPAPGQSGVLASGPTRPPNSLVLEADSLPLTADYGYTDS